MRVWFGGVARLAFFAVDDAELDEADFNAGSFFAEADCGVTACGRGDSARERRLVVLPGQILYADADRDRSPCEPVRGGRLS